MRSNTPVFVVVDNLPRSGFAHLLHGGHEQTDSRAGIEQFGADRVVRRERSGAGVTFLDRWQKKSDEDGNDTV
jgi:hypothetical protein